MTCMTHIRLFYHPSIIMKWSALPCRVQHSQPCWLHLSLLVHMHCTLHIVYLYCVQCGHCLAHKTCVNDTKKCRTLTAFSLRLCPDMQVASRKIILSHNIIITLCVSLMKKWVSACFLRRGGGSCVSTRYATWNFWIFSILNWPPANRVGLGKIVWGWNSYHLLPESKLNSKGF